MMASALMLSAGLVLHRGDVSPRRVCEPVFAGEHRGLIDCRCGWCGGDLGTRWGAPRQHGGVSHGICAPCAARELAEFHRGNSQS